MALVLERFLSQNTTQRIALEVDPFGFDERWLHDQLHPYLYVPYIDEPIVAENLAREFGARELAWRWIPLFKYAEFNERIGWPSVLEVIHHPPPEFDEWGSRLSAGRISDSAVRAIRDTSYRIDTERVHAFERILDVAAAHRVKLTMFMAPQLGAAARAVTDRARVLDDIPGARAGARPHLSRVRRLGDRERCGALQRRRTLESRWRDESSRRCSAPRSATEWSPRSR